MENLQDEKILCPCGNVFTWTVKDQIFYKQNNYVKPVRCPSCRKARKLASMERVIANQKGNRNH